MHRRKTIARWRFNLIPSRYSRSNGCADVEIGGPSTTSVVSLNFAAARVGAAHLCTLVLGNPYALIRRLRRIQPEQIGRNPLSKGGRGRRGRDQRQEGHRAKKEAGKAEVVHSGVLKEFQHDALFLVLG